MVCTVDKWGGVGVGGRRRRRRRSNEDSGGEVSKERHRHQVNRPEPPTVHQGHPLGRMYSTPSTSISGGAH